MPAFVSLLRQIFNKNGLFQIAFACPFSSNILFNVTINELPINYMSFNIFPDAVFTPKVSKWTQKDLLQLFCDSFCDKCIVEYGLSSY